MGQQPAEPGGLSRERLVAAGLETLEADGLDGLSMRAVADRLGVKAASLYWHVRDRRRCSRSSRPPPSRRSSCRSPGRHGG